jgi:Fungalysin metallopeptidase (M36)
VNFTGQGLGNDEINTEPLDGANTLCCVGGQPVGLSNNTHVNNANFSTPPDGINPRMQMFLFHYSQNPADPFVASNGGDEADIVYHEFTHGLSNRLVVDANGDSTLGGGQAGAMGEAGSDWYAYDFLNVAGVRAPRDGLVRRFRRRRRHGSRAGLPDTAAAEPVRQASRQGPGPGYPGSRSRASGSRSAATARASRATSPV